MAGIYLHIPFCKQACSYCDFHFSTSLRNKRDLLKALQKEIVQRKEELGGQEIRTIYFGGGTPSLLEEEELNSLLELLHLHYPIAANSEITLEANPDDLTAEKLKMLCSASVNRLSIGIQSFFDEDLRFMNRAHNGTEAWQSIVNAQEAGFNNITIDLIYGVPTLSHAQWAANLEKTASLNIPHVSAYCLTIEPGTALHHQIGKGRLPAPDEEEALKQFKMLMEWAEKNNYIHYEISNFGKEGRFSRHNTAYWKQEHYLGFGPAAHSYNGLERRWNVRNNMAYIIALEEGKVFFEKERLSRKDRYNEYIMTALRTTWGISREEIEKQFGVDYWKLAEAEVRDLITKGEIILSGNRLTLTENGKFVADKIAAQLFITE